MTIADVDKPVVGEGDAEDVSLTLEQETAQEAEDEAAQEASPVQQTLPRQRAASDEVIVIKRVHFNYAVIAVVFLFVGIIMGALLVNIGGGGANANLIATSVVAAIRDSGSIAAGPEPTEGPINVSLDDDPSWGPKSAPITIVEFSDFQCPYCERFYQQTYPQIKQKYGDKIHFVYRDYPLPAQIHPQAYIAALASECADEQGKFWAYHDLLFGNQDKLLEQDLIAQATFIGMDTDQFSQCLKSGKYATEVQKDLQDGENYGVTGTPTFFINGRRLVGAQAFARFEAIIDDELAKRGISSAEATQPAQ